MEMENTRVCIDKNLRDSLTPREMALYGMIAAYLSIPEFETTGGFKKMIKTQLLDGDYVFNETWNGLRSKGYLKMFRFPTSRSNFMVCYELRSIADLDAPSNQSLTAEEGKRYLFEKSIAYNQPSGKCYVIPREVLLDPRLSLHGKWLWLVMRDQMDLFEKGLLKDRDGTQKRYLVKEDIRLATGFRASSFERTWSDLKRVGYLIATRFFDKQNNLTRAEYALLDCV